jgi:hypothetical protein
MRARLAEPTRAHRFCQRRRFSEKSDSPRQPAGKLGRVMRAKLAREGESWEG